jgi:hypothetical protein
MKGGQQIEAKHGKVGQVVIIKQLPFEVGMDEPEPPEHLAAERVIREFRDQNPLFVANNDILDLAETVGKNANLAPDLIGDTYQLPRQVCCNYLGSRNTPPVELFQIFQLARLEPGEIAVQFFYINSSMGKLFEFSDY